MTKEEIEAKKKIIKGFTEYQFYELKKNFAFKSQHLSPDDFLSLKYLFTHYI